MKLLWHYTVDVHIPDILRCGYVDVARLYLAPGEKPVAWFSANQFWERTVRKLVCKTLGEASPPWGLEEMFSHGVHGVRIGVLPEAAPLGWTALRAQANIPSKMVRTLLRVAQQWGANPWDWYGSLTPVPAEQWQATEMWNGDEWTPFTYDNTRQELRIKELRTDDRLARAGTPNFAINEASFKSVPNSFWKGIDATRWKSSGKRRHEIKRAAGDAENISIAGSSRHSQVLPVPVSIARFVSIDCEEPLSLAERIVPDRADPRCRP